ncbi:hypothetical protein GCM10009117_16880 [Gangjinia marincola]|uniref:AMP-activated protein kinase glycogen-binding domain-containing protein n=1 Tax=Gangjinia marincola TaxID=578463 RepID=A0ABP3XX25_9FLAO
MTKFFLNTIYFLFFFTFSIGFSQENEVKGYRIDGDEIVFTFDKRDYEKASGDYGVIDFEDLEIKKVTLSGAFNNWSTKPRDDWRLIKIDENRYELRKKLEDFNDEFLWEFKYVVNNSYWAEPSDEMINRTRAIKNGLPLNAYNLKMYLAYPDEHGNKTFRLNGYYDAKNVVLSGSFNKWNERDFKMKRDKEGWNITLKLKPGEYEYKFIVDKVWMTDPANPNLIENEFGGYNSYLDIKKEVTFLLKKFYRADYVFLVGSFNNWSENQYQMKKTKDGWSYTTRLSAGKHHYKFIVDGKWITDPKNPIQEYDEDGNINSVRMVK